MIERLLLFLAVRGTVANATDCNDSSLSASGGLLATNATGSNPLMIRLPRFRLFIPPQINSTTQEPATRRQLPQSASTIIRIPHIALLQQRPLVHPLSQLSQAPVIEPTEVETRSVQSNRPRVAPRQSIQARTVVSNQAKMADISRLSEVRTLDLGSMEHECVFCNA
jgi:hypothetical protein